MLPRFLPLVAVASLLASLSAAPAGAVTIAEPDYRRIHFPVQGPVSFHEDFGDPRGGGTRTHEGNDLMGAKGQPLLATVDGTVTFIRDDSGGNAGNSVTIRDADGWRYVYLHVNNDTPGTDDGANLRQFAFVGDLKVGDRVTAGQPIAFLGDSGNAENTAPHLHFEIRKPDGTAVSPWTSLRLATGMPAGTRCAYGANPPAKPDPRSGAGYYVLGADGGIFAFGKAVFHGSVPGLNLGVPVRTVLMAATRSGAGYYLLGADGGIFAFGDAVFHGSVPGLGLRKVRAIDLRVTPSGNGYWVLGQDGGIFAFGDAAFFGSVPGVGVRTTVRKLLPTPSGQGYWILGDDGGVFSFGDARFQGSVPGLKLPRPVQVVAMTGTPTGEGYWVLASDGGVFSFGDAVFRGSIPGVGLCRYPKGVQMTASATGKGYWVLGDDGSTWAFGDAVDHGSVSELGLPGFAPTVDLVALPPTP